MGYHIIVSNVVVLVAVVGPVPAHGQRGQDASLCPTFDCDLQPWRANARTLL